MLRIVLFLLCFCSSFICAEESTPPAKKYALSVGAIFKNEAKYLKEWIEYHKLVGVEHFYLYNIGSTDNYAEVLNPYIDKGCVTLVHWTDFVGYPGERRLYLWALGTQIPAYENMLLRYALQETRWISFLDVDEFLVPPSTNSLLEILKKYQEFPGIRLVTDFFDAYRIDLLPPRKLVIETLELVKPPEQSSQKEVAKTIFKPELCHGFTWPPYACTFKNQQSAYTVRKRELRINHYVNRGMGVFDISKAREKLPIDNRLLADEELLLLLGQNYEIEDHERAIYRFLPPLMKNMGLTAGWEMELTSLK